MGLISHFNQEEPFDLSQKPPGLPSLRLSQSDGESIPGSSCQEEDEESLYRRSQYSPGMDQQEPSDGDHYISDLKKEQNAQTDKLRTGKNPKLKKYQESSEEESYEGEKKAQEQFDTTHRLLQSESSNESDAEVEQVYTSERVRIESCDYDTISEDECEQSKRTLEGSYEAMDVAEKNWKMIELMKLESEERKNKSTLVFIKSD